MNGLQFKILICFLPVQHRLIPEYDNDDDSRNQLSSLGHIQITYTRLKTT